MGNVMPQSAIKQRNGDKTPQKYKPTNIEYTRKEWLYEKYWGELLPIKEVADAADVSHTTIMREMERNGVPRRPRNMTADDHAEAGWKLRSYFVGDEQTTPQSERRTVAWTLGDD